MSNHTRKPNEFQLNSAQARESLLESTKLSRLPKLPTRPKFELPDFELSSDAAIAVCVGCAGRIESDNDFQQQIKVCRKCLTHYAKIDSAIDEASKRKRRELLERFAPEVKR
jgi:hypothetical protein